MATERRGTTSRHERHIDLSENENVLHDLKQIFQYTKIMAQLMEGIEETISGKDLALQNALIFCLKAIGVYIEKAARSLGIEPNKLPIFLKNLFYLRNTLIHHCPNICIPQECLASFTKICKNTGQIYNYFSKVVSAKNTDVDLGGQRYKVFLEIHELSQALKAKYSREYIRTLKQEDYLKVILGAINGIEHLTRDLRINEESLEEIRKVNPQNYYALQNLIELIATICNPNPEYSVLTEATRQAINSANPQADSWLRLLGRSRMEAMHRKGIIDSYFLAAHLTDMISFKSEVLLNFDFQARLEIDLSSRAGRSLAQAKQGPSASTTTIIQSLSRSSAIAAAPNEAAATVREPSASSSSLSLAASIASTQTDLESRNVTTETSANQPAQVIRETQSDSAATIGTEEHSLIKPLSSNSLKKK